MFVLHLHHTLKIDPLPAITSDYVFRTETVKKLAPFVSLDLVSNKSLKMCMSLSHLLITES